MPKRRVSVTYLCEICRREYSDQENARACENNGIAIPEFKRHQVVALTGLREVTVTSGLRFKVQDGTKGVIDREYQYSDTEPNPHLLTFHYEVWVAVPRGEQQQRGLVVISREALKPVTLKNGASCPLCASVILLSENSFESYWISSGGMILFSKVSVCKCPNCKVEFFTTKQLRQAKSWIKNKSRWPRANTRHLIEEHLFQY